MKTKIIKTIAALMLSLLSLPMMGQDFMEVYFKDGIYKKFYLEGLKEWKVSQYDADGVKHADYNYQHIKTNTYDFVFELEKIDSIVFTKFDEEKAKQDFDAAMTSVLSVLSENITAEEVETKLDFIKNSESVEDAWCSGHVLFVDVRNCGTINFYLYEDIVDDEETEDDINLANQMKAYIPQFKQMLSQNGRTPSIVVANQNHYDLSRTNRLKVYEKILDEFGQCGFDTTYLARPTIDFFATEMYNYDLILFISHGCYNDETKNHSFITGELLGSEIPISKNSDASEELIDECRKRFRELNETAKYRGIETVKISFQLEEGESGNVLRGYPSISEDFFGEGGTSQGSFRINSIFFNGCCQMFNGTTTETATSFADKFVKVHGLRLFLGYKFDNHYSPWAGSYFFRSMLCGKSTESAFNEVESKYKSKEKFLTGAELLFRRNDNDNGIFFITPTITSETDPETVKKDYYNSKVVSVKGYTTSLDLADIKCGFLYSTNKDFSSAINVIDNAPVKVSKPFADGRGNVVFRYDIKDLQPGNTYHYCAYTYDGKHYNYGNALSFYVPFELQLSTQDLSLIAGSTTTVEITSGNGDYTVSVDKPNIATATLSGTTITIKGEAKGTAKVTVKDKSGQTAEIKVTVWDNLTLSQSSVGLYPGNSTTVEITNGSGHYSVSVDKPAVATASLSGSKITIKGVGVGSAVVTVTDTSTNQTAKINVTVSSAPTLVVSNSSVNLIVGGSSTVEITSGSGSYEISNSNTRVVQTVLEGAKITLTAKSEGNAVVTVKDKVTGQTASISVTVNSIANLVLSQSNVNLAIGAEAIVEIVSGSGDYSVAVDKPAVATATLSGTKITIKGIATGTANVTVKDKSGQTAEIKVTVNSSSESYAVYNAGTLTFYHDQLKNSRGGSVYVLNTGENYPGWYDHDNINKVVFDKSFADARPTSTYRWFYEMNNLTSIEGIKNLNTSEVTNMYAMFAGCESLTSLDVSKFNTANVTDFSFIFWCCENLASLDVSNFKTEKVTDMLAMFYDCKNLISLDVSNFDTRNVTNMAGMFYGCESLTSLNVSNFNTANVTDMSFMFNLCENLTSLDVSNFDTKNVTDMAGMFQLCSNLTSLDVSNFNTANVTDMSWMFYSCTNLTSLDVKNFKTGNVTKMYAMFYGCESLTSLNVSNFNTANVTDMSGMFNHCGNLTSLNVSNFNTANVTDMSFMFNHCENLTSLDVSNFNTKNVTDMSVMFQCCSNLTSLDVSNFNTANVTDMSWMFNHCENLTFLDVKNFKTGNVTKMYAMFCGCESLTSLNVSNFNTANVTDMSFMFNHCENLTSLDVSNFDTKNVTDMAGMFQHCSNLTSLDVSNFNTANVTDMSWMFNHCENLTSLDVSNFDTKNVTDMTAMFQHCSNLTSLNVSKFNTANVTDMSGMFNYCENLTSLDVSKFNTANVTDMRVMFQCCSNLTSLDVSNFDTRNVTDMSWMFYDCESLTSLNVSSFNTEKVTNMCYMFYWCEKLTSLDVSNFDTRNVTDMRYMFFNCWNLNTLDVSNFIMAVCEDSECMFGYCDGLNSLAVSFTMENLNEDACAYVGYYEPCSIIAPDGFDFGVDTSGESFTWKSGYFKLGSGNTSILSFTVNGVSFKMVAVEGGTFMMGASDDDNEALSIEKPQHQVTLSSYYIGQVEVTQELWKAVMGTNPSDFKSSNKLPVECVSWDDCQRFIAKLNNLTGETFSLPTEAQWEFAARGGNYSNNYTYSGSNSLDFVAWYNGNSGGKTHNVATKVPNELGIFDMSGNVSEWCQDYYGKYSSNSQTNPTGPSSGSTRIYRGGFWDSYPSDCLIYKRDNTVPNERFNWIGLRLAL